MMRYQSVSPDCLPLPTGKKPTTITTAAAATATLKIYKEENHNRHLDTRGVVSVPSTCITKPLKKVKQRITDPSSSHDHAFTNFSVPSSEPTGNVGAASDVLLQWGQNKRSRGSRAESRTVGDDPFRARIQRRSLSGRDKEKHVAAAAMMLPPPSCGGYTRGTNLRPSVQTNRNAENKSNSHHRTEKRSPPSAQQKMHRTTANRTPSSQPDSTNPSSTPSEHEPASDGGVSAVTTTKPEKLNLAAFELPRIYLSLSRKEKEEDFYAMKGTKLPHRPKKRAKNVDKALQYCFPGLWLSDLTRGRYEVREKKCVKRKKRGLKAMEVDSDSE